MSELVGGPSAGVRRTPERAHEVVVVGDGPAGSALASALHRRGVDVLLVGGGAPWRATYGIWRDDVADSEVLQAANTGVRDVFATSVPTVRVAMHAERHIDRPYAIVDNSVLRRITRQGLRHLNAVVTEVAAAADHWRLSAEVRGRTVDIGAEIVVDATGWPPRLGETTPAPPIAWQTAWGVVLAEPPTGPLGSATVMDWTAPGGIDHETPTFAYAFPVEDGWLVEETVLASREPVDPDALRPVLARRLGWTVDELERRTLRSERVCIPMGAPVPPTPQVGSPSPVAYGAAAALANPVTGYQLAPALTFAGPVATALVAALRAPFVERDAIVASTIWSRSRRRTRALHEFGLDVLLRLDADSTRDFFEVFFELPDDVWPAQMRIDSTPSEISRLMLQMFRAAPWKLRRRLVTGDPRLGLGAVRLRP